MTEQNKLELVREIEKKYGELFQKNITSFNNLIWQVVVNEVHKDKKIVFTAVYTDGGLELVLAHPDGGYIPTGVYFLKGDYNEGSDIADDISMIVFKIDSKEVFVRQARSMRNNSRTHHIAA